MLGESIVAGEDWIAGVHSVNVCREGASKHWTSKHKSNKFTNTVAATVRWLS